MGKTLVIVESPAKAKTIARFLGSGYAVEATFGHVRDLPESAKDVPEEFKKTAWGKLGVNVAEGYKPLYIVPGDKSRSVANLRKAAKDADTLLLATDEDREGESISWHVLELLKPKKSVPVRRIVFHEITPEAIQAALRNPRDLDQNLVRAQEARRVLDRLYGYTLSPVLWQRIAPNLSAGRVQSVAVRLLVERERERMRFVPSTYWDLEATLAAPEGTFIATLARLDGRRLATGKSFAPETGTLRAKNEYHLLEPEARALAPAAEESEPWRVTKLETNPGKESPPPPFMTSTLQQEANRKLRMPARKAMQVAQGLYEGVDLDGERVGLITYMRTDSLTLAERALSEAREVIRDLYGPEYLPEKPVRYRTKSKNAQEAHEAIRPTDLGRRPQDVKRYLTSDQFALYELIWKRTIACQMVPARVERTQVEVTVLVQGREAVFAAGGKRIVFPGFLRAYVEGSDDPEADLDERERILPKLVMDDQAVAPQYVDLKAKEVVPNGHTTKPPARYTEASLVKKLEEEGVGRPSTYASIIGTIQDRGYCFKAGAELVPTFSAFSVIALLENHFGDLVDLKFTARMEEELDEISNGSRESVPYLEAFYVGTEGKPGISLAVEQRKNDIPYPRIEIGTDPVTGEPVTVRVGKFGAYVQRGEGGEGNRTTIPNETVPGDLSLEKALEILARKAEGPQRVGVNPTTGEDVFIKKGPYGTYLETEAPGAKTPKRVTVPPALNPEDLDQETVERLLTLPRSLGVDPQTGEDVTVNVGRYGAYLKRGETNRTLEPWDRAFDIDLNGALTVFAQAPTRGASTVKTVLREFAAVGEAPALKVLTGYYGPYVTDGKHNATIPKGQDIEALSVEQARALIQAKIERGPSPKKGRFAGRARKKTR
ncbi:MAG: type I DNA topoisomerase [Fimbriimonadaceae bacterium]|nr:type I DNA topoisomerase [Fimbriimonadaceae bacterium]